MKSNGITIPSTARNDYNSYHKTATNVIPVTPARYDINPSMSSSTIDAKPETVINWINNVQSALPGISDVKLRPTVTVIECKIVGGNKSDAKCPNAFNSTGSEAYASVVEIMMRWKLPNQKCDTSKEQSIVDSCVRKHSTSMYIMYDELDYLN
jgi:hypothetical protein